MKPASLAFLLAVMSAPLAAQSPINVAALVSRTDSFVVLVQGNPLGFQRTTIERTETGLRMIDDVQIGPIMTQHTEVEFAPDGAMRSTRQTGQVRRQTTSIDIAYHDGRAKGTAPARQRQRDEHCHRLHCAPPRAHPAMMRIASDADPMSRALLNALEADVAALGVAPR